MTKPQYTNYTRYSQFREMQKSNPRLFWSPAVQMAIHSLAEKHGTEFFTTPSRTADPQPDLTSTPVQSDFDRQERISALKRQIEELESANTSLISGGNENA